MTVCVGCAAEETPDGTGAVPTSAEPPSPPDGSAGADASVPADDGAGRVPDGFFGGRVVVGAVDDVVRRIDDADGFLYLPSARAWLVRYPADRLDAAAEVYDDATLDGMRAGFVALYQKCTHLGCRVPECISAERFECPCHGQIFNRVGEWVAGPAPRGLDRFAVRVRDGVVALDTGAVLDGADIGVLTVDGDVAEGGTACLP